MTAREVARRVLDRVDRGGAWATLTLDGELARSGLADRDRRLASELVYGVLRNRTRIDRTIAAHADLKRTPPRVLSAMRVAVYQLVFLDRVPSYAAVDDAVTAARGIGGAKLGGFVNAVLRKIGTAGEPPLPSDLHERLAIEHSLPRWILDELAATSQPAPTSEGLRGAVPSVQTSVEAVGSGAAASSATAGDAAATAGDAAATAGVSPTFAELAAAFAQPAPLVGRANRRVTTRDAVIAELRAAGASAEPVALAAEAIRIDGLGDPSQSPSFAAGRWTVQDAGAQLVGHVAAPRPGTRILDACAGVGGKSTHLAELADDAAAIDAADQSATKLGLLRETATRLGLGSITTRVCDLLDPAAPLGPAYDLIVLDAPCTGLGVLRRHPDAKWRLVPDDVPRMAALQARLLDAVVPRVAPGGALVYSVCTFTHAEGPDQVRALAARSGLALVAEHRTWPPEADAFYIAKLVRR